MLSIVIPVFDEADNILELHRELQGVLEKIDCAYEIIYVDDGSLDNSFELLQDLARKDPRVVVLRFRRNFGQTAALAAGIDASSGDVLVFMDADLQNDPADIPRLLAKLEDGGYDIVSGWRVNRQDAALSRRLPSRTANWIISAVSGVQLNDYGCTLKAYRREVLQTFHLYGEMHRFIPAYAAWGGARIAELPVNHRPRKFGRSKYGISRTLKVILDLVTLKFLSAYSTKPSYLFGGLGALCLVMGVFAFGLTLLQKVLDGVWVHRNPILSLGVFLLLAGLLFITQGLLAELIMRTYHESHGRPTYVLRTAIRSRISESQQSQVSRGSRARRFARLSHRRAGARSGT